jgi:hypothetical protein
LYLVVNKLKKKKTAAQDVSLMKNIITFYGSGVGGFEKMSVLLA